MFIDYPHNRELRPTHIKYIVPREINKKYIIKRLSHTVNKDSKKIDFTDISLSTFRFKIGGINKHTSD